jgi:hypothetical protein
LPSPSPSPSLSLGLPLSLSINFKKKKLSEMLTNGSRVAVCLRRKLEK